MKKRRGALGVIGIILLVFLAVILVGVYYAYNFYVFKEIRICVGEGVATEAECVGVQDCLDFVGKSGMKVELEGAPDFLQKNFDDIVDEAIYCENVCYIGDVRGVDFETQELLDLESCEEGEFEFLMEIRGKEGIEILKFVNSLRDDEA